MFWYKSTSFSDSMWYMPFLSTYSVSFWPLEVGYRATRVFDSGWRVFWWAGCLLGFFLTLVGLISGFNIMA